MSIEIPTSYSNTRLIVVMGVTGCGKSTVGSQLADLFSCGFIEGDNYHSRENKEKMQAGIALTDEDRWPWLKNLAQALAESSGRVVASCSSLKRSYREAMLRHAGEPVLFVYLCGSEETLANRLANRQGHFMSRDLLSSQLATLEVPDEDEFSFAVDVDASAAEIVDQIGKTLL